MYQWMNKVINDQANAQFADTPVDPSAPIWQVRPLGMDQCLPLWRVCNIISPEHMQNMKSNAIVGNYDR